MTPPAGQSGRDLVIGVSLKMYFSYEETLDWCARVRAIVAANPVVSGGAVQLFVMPSLPYLLPVIEMFAGTAVEVGAQNFHFEDRGPFTGEVSGPMLAELGCHLVEVGHSERRRLFGETERVVAMKVEAALRNGLRPVICVGEKDETNTVAARRESRRQLESSLSYATRKGLRDPVVIAYEPQWAIGAHRPASDAHIVEVCVELREFLRQTRPGSSDRVIYGGSARPGLLERLGPSVDGLFLGRYVHDPGALESVLDEARRVSSIRVVD